MSYLHEAFRKLLRGERFAEDELAKALAEIDRHEAASEAPAAEPPAAPAEEPAPATEGASDGAQ